MKNPIIKKTWYSKSHNIESIKTYSVYEELWIGEQILHGPYKWYHDNGQIAEIGLYKNGKKDGLWKWYYYSPKNEIRREQTFKDGKLIDEVDYSKAASSSGCMVVFMLLSSSVMSLIYFFIVLA